MRQSSGLIPTPFSEMAVSEKMRLRFLVRIELAHKVKWLNKLLTKMWPFIADAATMVIRDSVEPLLEDYRPTGISSIKFSKLSLGTVPPKIEGIRVQSTKQGQITMDIDLKWGGDPDIILGIDAFVASLPIQLKDLQVFTIIRVIFQLCEEIPCISAVVIALLAEPKPRIDYTIKAIGGSLTALPRLSDMINDTVMSIITDMLQWPKRIVVPLGGVDVDTSELELRPQGRVKVTVMKAHGLKNMEMLGKSDPYTVLYIRPLLKVKTKVIDNDLNPVWNETFELIAEDKETQAIIFEVYDEDNLQQDKKLGVAKLPLHDLEPGKSMEIELSLLSSLDTLKVKDTKDRGTLTIKVFYHALSKQEQIEALEEEKKELEDKKKLKEAGMINTVGGAVGGAVGRTASLVGSGASLVGTGVGAGVGFVGSSVGAGVGLVGSGVGAGVNLVGSGVGAGAGIVSTGVGASANLVSSGVGAGVGLVGSGFGAVGSGLTKAGKFMGKTVTGQFNSGRKTTHSGEIKSSKEAE